jgi:hypothetical protein
MRPFLSVGYYAYMTHVMLPPWALSLFLQNITAVRELGARRMLFNINSFPMLTASTLSNSSTTSSTTKVRGYLHGF